MRLEGKVAVITGAGGGIGRAIAETFHREGARVVVADISGAQKETADHLGDGAVAVHADVTRGDDVQAMIESAVSNFGRLDILCNVAGIDGAMAPTGETTEETFDRVMAINARGVFLGMRHAIPEMLENGGSIINMASIGGMVALPFLSPYSASKGAVLQLSRVAAVEYAERNIRVNTICPGAVKTTMVDDFPELTAQAVAMTPMKRMATTGEIASVALFLACDESSYVTGSTLTVDGGYTAL